MNLIKKGRRLEKLSYTDKEMQISTQIAYMNITNFQIDDYADKHNGEYPTIQEIPVCKDNQTYNTSISLVS